MPDVQKLTGGQIAKASKSSARKTKESKGGDGSESEEDTKYSSAKVMEENKTNNSDINGDDDESDPDEGLRGTQSKNRSARKITKGKNDEDTKGRKTIPVGKGAAGKLKSVEIDDSAEDEDDIHGNQKNAKVAKVAKTSRKRVVSGQNKKQVKKKAK